MLFSMKQKVVIIGHGYTSRLGIIRSLAELDCEITVIAMVFHNWFGRFIRFDWGKPIDCYSKYVSRMMYCKINDSEELIQLLLEKCTDSNQKVVIIPDSDFSAMVIDDNQERLRESFLFPHIQNTPGLVKYWMDKSVQKKLALQIGMNVAHGIVVPVKDHQFNLPKNICYPCFTKALATVSGGKQFLRRCNNEGELIKVLNSVSQSYETDVLVEDYKQIETEYAVVGVSDGKNVYIPGIIKFLVNCQSHFGIAREGMIIPLDGFESIIIQFISYIKTIGFCGLFDIDFYESEGSLYFSELNLRFGGSGYAVTKMGFNLPVLFVSILTENKYEIPRKYVSSMATYVNERMCVDDYIAGKISKKEYNNIVVSADICFVHDSFDPNPQRKFKFNYLYVELNRQKNLFRKLRKKLCSRLLNTL